MAATSLPVKMTCMCIRTVVGGTLPTGTYLPTYLGKINDIFFVFYFIGDTTILEEDAASHEPRTSTSSRVRRDNHHSLFIIISSSHINGLP